MVHQHTLFRYLGHAFQHSDFQRSVRDEDAEELIQELMLFIWENRNSLFVEISLKSYLFMAVKHRCLNAIKRQLYHERVHSLIYDLSLIHI